MRVSPVAHVEERCKQKAAEVSAFVFHEQETRWLQSNHRAFEAIAGKPLQSLPQILHNRRTFCLTHDGASHKTRAVQTSTSSPLHGSDTLHFIMQRGTWQQYRGAVLGGHTRSEQLAEGSWCVLEQKRRPVQLAQETIVVKTYEG